jgi:hypothetical protein
VRNGLYNQTQATFRKISHSEWSDSYMTQGLMLSWGILIFIAICFSGKEINQNKY